MELVIIGLVMIPITVFILLISTTWVQLALWYLLRLPVVALRFDAFEDAPEPSVALRALMQHAEAAGFEPYRVESARPTLFGSQRVYEYQFLSPDRQMLAVFNSTDTAVMMLYSVFGPTTSHPAHVVMTGYPNESDLQLSYVSYRGALYHPDRVLPYHEQRVRELTVERGAPPLNLMDEQVYQLTEQLLRRWVQQVLRWNSALKGLLGLALLIGVAAAVYGTIVSISIPETSLVNLSGLALALLGAALLMINAETAINRLTRRKRTTPLDADLPAPPAALRPRPPRWFALYQYGLLIALLGGLAFGAAVFILPRFGVQVLPASLRMQQPDGPWIDMAGPPLSASSRLFDLVSIEDETLWLAAENDILRWQAGAWRTVYTHTAPVRHFAVDGQDVWALADDAILYCSVRSVTCTVDYAFTGGVAIAAGAGRVLALNDRAEMALSENGQWSQRELNTLLPDFLLTVDDDVPAAATPVITPDGALWIEWGQVWLRPPGGSKWEPVLFNRREPPLFFNLLGTFNGQIWTEWADSLGLHDGPNFGEVFRWRGMGLSEDPTFLHPAVSADGSAWFAVRTDREEYGVVRYRPRADEEWVYTPVSANGALHRVAVQPDGTVWLLAPYDPGRWLGLTAFLLFCGLMLFSVLAGEMQKRQNDAIALRSASGAPVSADSAALVPGDVAALPPDHGVMLWIAAAGLSLAIYGGLFVALTLLTDIRQQPVLVGVYAGLVALIALVNALHGWVQQQRTWRQLQRRVALQIRSGVPVSADDQVSATRPVPPLRLLIRYELWAALIAGGGMLLFTQGTLLAAAELVRTGTIVLPTRDSENPLLVIGAFVVIVLAVGVMFLGRRFAAARLGGTPDQVAARSAGLPLPVQPPATAAQRLSSTMGQLLIVTAIYMAVLLILPLVGIGGAEIEGFAFLIAAVISLMLLQLMNWLQRRRTSPKTARTPAAAKAAGYRRVFLMLGGQILLIVGVLWVITWWGTRPEASQTERSGALVLLILLFLIIPSIIIVQSFVQDRGRRRLAQNLSSLLQRGQYAEARALLQPTLTRRPRRDVRIAAILLAFYTERLDDMTPHLVALRKEAAKMIKGSTEQIELLQLCLSFEVGRALAVNDTAAAIGFMQQHAALGGKPTPETCKLWARLHLLNGDTASAETALTEAAALYGVQQAEQNPEFLALQAWVLAQRGDDAAADARLSAALQCVPPEYVLVSAEIYRLGGLMARSRGRDEVARLAFERAAAIDPHGLIGRLSRRDAERLAST